MSIYMCAPVFTYLKKKVCPICPDIDLDVALLTLGDSPLIFNFFFFHPDKYFQMTLFFHTLIILEIDGSFGSFLFFQDLIFVPEKIFHLVPCIPFCCSISCI